MADLRKFLPGLFLLLTLCLLLLILGIVGGQLGELPRQLARKVQGADHLVVPVVGVVNTLQDFLVESRTWQQQPFDLHSALSRASYPPDNHPTFPARWHF